MKMVGNINSNERGINEKKMETNNKKKIIFGIVFFALIILIIGIIIILSNKSPKSVCERIENGYCIYEGVPKYLKFQEPVAIDKSELWNYSKTPAIDYFILKNPNNYSEGHLCTDTNKSPEYVWYFRKICNEGGEDIFYLDDCYHSRRATLCGTFYLVQEFKIGKNISSNDALYYIQDLNMTRFSYGPYNL
jgi:hypothetical protein